MKTALALLTLTLVTPVFADIEVSKTPILEREIGKEGHSGIISTCQIFTEKVGVKWDDVKKLVAKAAEEVKVEGNFDVKTYVRFNSPSKLYWANHIVPATEGKKETVTKVVLLSDGGSFKGLKTETGKALLKLITNNCGLALPVDPKVDKE